MTPKTDRRQGQQHHQEPDPRDVADVLVGDADVDDAGHQQRHAQLGQDVEEDEDGGQEDVLPVSAQVTGQLLDQGWLLGLRLDLRGSAKRRSLSSGRVPSFYVKCPCGSNSRG